MLTGTPLQNNIEELFSLLNFLNPRKFDSFTAFMKDFGDLKTEEQVDKLKSVSMLCIYVCSSLKYSEEPIPIMILTKNNNDTITFFFLYRIFKSYY